jgi:competence protein ComEC
MLLALLAMPILAMLGVSLRARLACVLVLIAIYVPLTGAGPSIQRAGVMGAAGVIALLAGRPRSRWYAVLLAAFATLAVNPRASGDAGWQLSFAAVVGIMLWTRRLRDALLDARARERDGLGWRRAVAEGAAVTIAATLATAPLMAHHFGALSVASLPANLLALPAVAPVMWLGMLAAAVGQLPWLPVEPLTCVAGLLAAYIAAVAHWLGAPAWARLSVSLPGPIGVIATYAALAAALELLLAAARRRAGLARRAVGAKPVAAALALVLIVVLAASVPPAERLAGAPPGLRIMVLDVGQGDAILLDPADGDPVLIDGGPPGDELRSRLESEGVSRLAAAIVTHDQSDHAGGLEDVLGQMPVDALLHGGPVPGLLPDARAAGIRATAIAEGAAVDSGALHLDVLWPPRPLLDVAGHPEDPNRLALVLLARWHGFEMLLTGDAEAEAAPVDPGPIDVLKVAHHGSADVGLDALLGRAAPRLAVISVGSDNPYGHPAPETLSTLSEHGVPTLRTDQDGNVTIDVTRAGWRIDTDGG